MTILNERKKALEALLGFEQPVEQHRTALAAFSWDSDTELAFLSVGHTANILNRFASGRTSAIEVENWANAVEGRDDIGFESPNDEMLRELVHELANPLLTQPLTRERAFELLKKIEAASGSIM
jgi:hypothetical protein